MSSTIAKTGKEVTTVKMFPAKNGDSFLVREISSSGVGTILIDGGFASTFRESILPELTNWGNVGQQLDLIIVTHIDEDHILGIISLIKANGESSSPKILPIKEVWHNSLRSISPPSSTGTTGSIDQTVLDAICSTGFELDHGDRGSSTEISGRQGSSLAALLRKGGYRWNGGDGKQSITCSTTPPLNITETMRVHVLGPTSERLTELRTSWMRELRRVGILGPINNGEIFDDAFEFMTARSDAEGDRGLQEISHCDFETRSLSDAYCPDTSPNNGSSISVIIETPSARMLFLGDAWAESTEEAIISLRSNDAPVMFDAIKISHHGSVRNTSQRLLELVDAPVYFISTDGTKHGHPEIPVLHALVDRPAKFARQLHFNYSNRASKSLRHYQSASGTAFSIHEDSTDWIEIKRGNA